ncbi:MAG: family 16 glycosylhydrolase [Clostridia bacterium]|nr:family 16 glycosylhydrolase [Clostridia bacterium]MDD3970460.1 family 16 glycosylhydrolase [Clostridia bacterium]
MKKDNETINWMGYEWLNRQTWGRVHPDDPIAWMDPNCVKVENNILQLHTRYNPKRFGDGQSSYVAETAIGLVSCQHPFHFGDYEIEAKLPTGKYLWPAIWLWSLTNWPPEIDIIEAYSNKKGSYFNWAIYPYRIKSNLHYAENGNKSTGAKSIWVGLKKPEDRFIRFQMKWRPDKIMIGSDGCYSRTYKGGIMKHFQEPMRFVINNGIQNKYRVGSDANVFLIKSFKYTKMK